MEQNKLWKTEEKSYDPNMVQKRAKKSPKTVKNDQKLSKIGPKMIKKRQKFVQKLSKNSPKTVQRFGKNEIKQFLKVKQTFAIAL